MFLLGSRPTESITRVWLDLDVGSSETMLSGWMLIVTLMWLPPHLML